MIRLGGSAILAETDELIGADAFILDKVRNIDVAKKFMATQARYEHTANVMGVSAQWNFSVVLVLRCLFNIAMKSLGAAMKKSESTRLEGVLEYAERIQDQGNGYYFMDTPGNDIESVTGQVAGGCSVIMFSTDNGSITNFQFVPISLCRSEQCLNLPHGEAADDVAPVPPTGARPGHQRGQVLGGNVAVRSVRRVVRVRVEDRQWAALVRRVSAPQPVWGDEGR